MSFTKFTLAAALLISLTACSSGSSNHSSSNNTELQTKLALAEQNVAKANAELETLKQTQSANSELQTKLTQAEQNVTKANAELATLKQQNSANSAQLAELQNQLKNAQKAVMEATEAKVAAQAQRDSLQTQFTAGQNQLKAAQSDLSAAQQQLQKAQADQRSTQADLDTAKQNLAKAEQAVSEAKAAKQAVENQLNLAKSELSTAQKTLENRNAVWNEIVKKGREALAFQGRQAQKITQAYSDYLPAGLSSYPFIMVTNNELDGIFVGSDYVYLSPKSDVRMFARTNTAFWNDAEFNGEYSFRVSHIQGAKTTDLPSGTATYSGIAFAANTKGTLNYAVDFGAKTGEGKITHLNNVPDIQLKQGEIKQINEGQGPFHRIRTQAATQTGDKGEYYLDFFGQNAETVAGKLYMFKSYDGVVKSNGGEMENFNAQERGTVFGLVGERQP